MAPKVVYGICPSCKKRARFVYIGDQDLNGGRKIHLYNCGNCGTSISLKRIRRE